MLIKKHLLLLIMAMLFSTVTAFAQDCDYSGTIGQLQWCLKNETLTISGNGEMPDYYFQGEPWHEYRAYIITAVVGSGVTSIGSCAFSDCVNLTLITISGSVTSIGNGAFASCLSLGSIIIPSGVTSIGMQAFNQCINLTSITVENANNHYTSENGVLFDKNKNTLICYPAGKLGAYVIPSSVISIGYEAFIYCANLTSVTIPGSVISIETGAFSSCTGLTSITISSSVTSIGNRVFRGCTNLTSINVESSNNSYASEDGVLFDKNKNTLIYCPEGKIGEYVIPGSVTSIGDNSFIFCIGLTSITIPASVTSIVRIPFSYCTGLTSIIVENSNSHYASENGVLFDKNKTTLICCPAGKTETYIIPGSVISIGDNAFYWCTGLTSITIPSSVKIIGNDVFEFCYDLTSITNLNPIPVEIYSSVFYGVNQSDCTLKVPISAVSAYENAEVWKEFNIVGIEVGVETVEPLVVKVYPNPTSGKLKIENGTSEIEDVAIYDIFGKIQKIENWKTENTIDISHLPAGVYFVKISTEVGEVTRKVLKE